MCHQSCPASAFFRSSCTKFAVRCIIFSSVIILVSSADKFVYLTTGRLVVLLFLDAFVSSFVQSFRISFLCSLPHLSQCSNSSRSFFRSLVQFVLQQSTVEFATKKLESTRSL